jgi:NAD-dependent SIR2 family protein deacetylase/uncharacterized coiled-coil protein SlyX
MMQSARDVQYKELKDMIGQLNNTVSSQNKTMESMTAMLAEKDQRIAELTEELRLLRKKLFGASKERTVLKPDENQLDLFSDLGFEPEPEPVDAEFIEVKAHKKAKKKKATFDEQFGNLRVKKVYVDTLSDEEKTCGICGSEMKPIGTERIRRDVVHVKPELYVIEYMATTYECPTCKDTEDPQFVKDEGAPPALLDHSYVTEPLAAWVFYQKFALAIPYYRLEKSFEVTVITQNVDDLHERGGSTDIIHLHGELMKVCSSREPYNEAYVKTLSHDNIEIKVGDRAADGSQLRPFIVWFGESVPRIEDAIKGLKGVDAFVIVGTSMNVYPAAGLLSYVPYDVPVFLIDPNEVHVNDDHEITVIQKGASEGMRILADEYLSKLL